MSTEYDKTMATQAQAAQGSAQPPAKRVGLLARLFGRGKACDRGTGASVTRSEAKCDSEPVVEVTCAPTGRSSAPESPEGRATSDARAA